MNLFYLTLLAISVTYVLSCTLHLAANSDDLHKTRQSAWQTRTFVIAPLILLSPSH